MFLQEIDGILPGQFVQVRYDCNGDFERCGKEWRLKLKDVLKNHQKNDGKLICHKCQLKLKNPMNNEIVKEKIKKTNLERYGTECSLNTKELIEKRSQKYEDKEYVAKVVAKRRRTSMEKYGVDHPMKTEEVKKRQESVIMEKYGVAHPLQNAEILEKAKQTNMERYGEEWGLACDKIRQKGIETMLEKYGVTHYNQLPEMKEYLRENCTQWLNESYENPWAKGIKRPEEWNQKQRETISELIQQGKWLAGHKNTLRGYYLGNKCKRKISFFRSGFELLMHYFLDHSELVEWYDYEPFYIEYDGVDGNKHHYHPDFLVKYYNNNTLHIKEVKADYLHDSEDTKAKYAGIMGIVDDKNFTFEVLLKEDVYAFGLDILEIKKLPIVILVHDPSVK